MLDSLFRALAPASVLVCVVDDPQCADLGLPSGETPIVASGGCDTVAGAIEAGEAVDLIWLRGRPSWHALGALRAGLERRTEARGGGLPGVFVTGAPVDPVGAWTTNEGYAAHLERSERSKEGVRLGLSALATRLAPDATLLSCPPGRGAWALLPAAVVPRVEAWLAARTPLLDALEETHRERVEQVARSLTLFELLDRSQRTAMAVVRSTRFRVGTRLVRLGRTVLRRDEFFDAPGQIVRRQRAVDTWRARLEAERPATVAATAPDALRVTYLLPEVRLSGGALVVLQLVNELRLLGVDANLAALRARGDAYRSRLLARPMLFGSQSELIRQLPVADIVVATHWSTASTAKGIVDAGRARHAAYLVQDYEAWFYPESEAETRAQVVQTYGLIQNRIVTSEWLRQLLEQAGHAATKISPGLDLGFFYPRRVPPVAARPVVLAMARPRTPRRGFDTVVDALSAVHRAMPSVEIVLFGEQIRGRSLPFPYRGVGVVTSPDRLARLYTRARVHFDGSDFQAFGRSALEAMACGAVSVLTDVGGVREYARDDENALLVPARDPDAAAAAIVRLLSDDTLHTRLRERGLATVRSHSMSREAVATLELFERIRGARA